MLIKIRVPIFAAASWTSIVSLTAAQFLDPIRDIYEVCHFAHPGVWWSYADGRL